MAIIGGGFTGLTAALRLVEAGCAVTVIESGAELGGLAASFEIGGEPLEKAYHHLFRTDVDILQLMAQLGIADCVEWHDSSLAIYRNGRTWPFMTAVDLLRFRPSSMLGRVRLGLTALWLKHKTQWRDLVGISAMEWMRMRCGASATRAVWEPLLRGKFAAHADRISMAWLWARLHIRANSRDTGGGKEKLGYPRGGFVRLVDALEARLRQRGVEILTSCRVEAISADGGRVRLAYQTGRHGFDAVIFTGSNRALATLITNQTPAVEAFREALQRIHYLGAVCLVFQTEQKLGDFYWVNVGESGAPFLVLIRHTKLVPAQRYGGKEVYYLGAYLAQDGRRFNASNEELESEWFDYLQKMHPEFDRTRVEARHLFRFRDAQHVVDCDYGAKIPPPETPVPGLFLANFSQVFPEDRGTTYAVRAGNAVAGLVAGWLGRRSGGAAVADSSD